MFANWMVQNTVAFSAGLKLDWLGADSAPTSYQDMASGEAPNIVVPVDEFSYLQKREITSQVI